MFHLDKSSSSYFITSESVSRGHPDKVADRISDEILDYFMSVNKNSHVAIEAMVTCNNVIVAGEVLGVEVDVKQIEDVVRETIRDIGYCTLGFDWKTVEVTVLVHEQSQDIVLGVGTGKKKGAGDQGVMYGYAIKETESFMPSPIYYSHLVLRNIDEAITNGSICGLGPDAKTEITVLYMNNKPVRVLRAVLSVQHDENMTQEDVRGIVYPHFVSTIPRGWMCDYEDFLVNPTGRFVFGGPACDTGITGRKIMVDTYGGHIPHGGGAFSGKDPSKVDRSAVYMARYIAKNVVHSKLADECLVQMSYAIGGTSPLTFSINTFGTGIVDNRSIERCIVENVDLSVNGICERLSLLDQVYSPTSCYGHFGRTHEKSFSWEKTDLSLFLSKSFNLCRVEEVQ